MAEIGAYGDVVFEVNWDTVRTFEQLRQKKSGRYATLNVANHEQLLQYEGKELQDVSFTIHLHHRFTDPQKEIEKMIEMVDGHEAHALVVGGWYLGKFVLKDVSSTLKRVADNGVIMSALSTLTLKEYL